jgi:hypothetical protein
MGGVVTRLSGEGNAILNTEEGRELNLGPLGDEVVGETVKAVKLSGPWGVCLDPRFISDEYLSELSSSSTSIGSTAQLRSLVQDARLGSDESATSEDVGRIVRVQLDPETDGGKFDEGKRVVVQLPSAFGETDVPGEVPVKIIAVREGIAFGCLALEQLNTGEIATSDPISVTVQNRVGDSGETVVGYTTEAGVPVRATGKAAPSGASILTGVSHVYNTHVSASTESLPPHVWPDLGEIIEVSIHEVSEGGTGHGLAGGLPVEMEDGVVKQTELSGFTARVVDREGDRLVASVKELSADTCPIPGDVVEVAIEVRGENEAVLS